jgi:hypothetical protein
MYEYEISESALIKKAIKLLLIVSLLSLPVMIVGALIVFNTSIRYALVICTIALLYLQLIEYIMRDIIDLILERVPDGAFVQTKRWLLNWKTPFVPAIVCWLSIGITFYILYLIDKLAFNIF